MAKRFSAMWMLAAILAVTANGVMGASVADNFDSYTAGVVIPAGNGWVGWGGDTANGIVTAGPANSAPNSLAVVGGAGTDQVLELGYGAKTGEWQFSTMTYVPSAGKAGETYFNLMNKFDDAGGTYQWSNVEISWVMDPAQGDLFDKVYLGTNTAGALDITYDTWVEVRADIDLTNDTVKIFYNGVSLGESTWAKSGQEVHGIDVMDIYPISADASVMYYDDISLTEVPEPASMSLLALGGLALLRRRRK